MDVQKVISTVFVFDKDSNDDQAPEDSIQEIQQAEPEDLLDKTQCLICFDKTEEDSRMYLYMCCEKWTCITCSLKCIEKPGCMLCNVDKMEDRLAGATTVLLD